MRWTASLTISAALLGIFALAASSFAEPGQKMGPLAARRAGLAFGSSRVIISAADTTQLPDVADAIDRAGGRRGRALPIIDAYVADMPNVALFGLSRQSPYLAHLTRSSLSSARWNARARRSARRRSAKNSATTAPASASRSSIRASPSWHDDLTGGGGPQRVDSFVDFVNGRDDAVRRLRPRHARRRHHRRQRLRLGRRAIRHRAGRALDRPEGARRHRPAAASATSSPRSTTSSRTKRR